jgi:hypothetical protein
LQTRQAHENRSVSAIPAFFFSVIITQKQIIPLISIGNHLPRRVTIGMNQKGEKHEGNYP